MKQVILLSIILFSSFVFLGQNSTDSQGRKQGEWVKYHKDGKTIRYKGQFKDDEPVGKFVYYYESGEVQSILEYEEAGLASAKTYYTSGSLMAKGYYLDQGKNGTWYYFSIDKMLIAKEVYLNGQLHGVSYKFFPTEPGANPIVLEAVNYVNGLAQGEWARYYKDGKVQVKGNYLDGLQSGECIWYSTSGEIESVGYFKLGKKHGRWRFYQKNADPDDYTEQYYLNGFEIKDEALEKYLKAQGKSK